MSRGDRWRRAVLLIALAFVAMPPTPAQAALPELIAAAAHHAGVHSDLLTSIVWVESRAWPWALNVNGLALYPRTRTEAERVLARVGDDVDIGYAQISYRHWGRSLGLRKADLLEPWTNLVVGALILRHSMRQEVGWAGVRRYHSATPHRKLAYQPVVKVGEKALVRSAGMIVQCGPWRWANGRASKRRCGWRAPTCRCRLDIRSTAS
jgi:hypothetical protein